ncbi:universal stress protein [Streptomyces jietaisiensis]|uniref:universal stress protein n=1 Tax=Streptomyces griseoaurantiacus TaxID=68213 RepID=UPI002E27D644|nr:universal stress protein [Streptomyces jietaisiensis]
MPPPLVVGVDGSGPGLRAVDWAAEEAALRGIPLRLVYASLWERYEGPALAPEIGGPDGKASGEDILRGAALRARHHRPGLPVTTALVPEEPEYTLIHESRGAAAVVVGTRGRGALTEALLGSVGMTVATHADCAVVVVRDGGDRTPGDDPPRTGIVVGTADTPTPAMRFAYEAARRRRAPLTAVRAWRCPSHDTADQPLLAGEPERLREERAARQLEAALADTPPDVELGRRTIEGPAGRVLPEVSRGAALLVIGRRRPGHGGPRLGRVAHRVLHHCDCPVAIVPDDS